MVINMGNNDDDDDEEYDDDDYDHDNGNDNNNDIYHIFYQESICFTFIHQLSNSAVIFQLNNLYLYCLYFYIQ